MTARISLPEEAIAQLCRKWEIVELSLFGSVLRDDFRPDSDVDVLVTFAPEASHTLFDMVHLHEELCEVLGREVDIVTRDAIERSPNYLRREAILGSAETVYAA